MKSVLIFLTVLMAVFCTIGATSAALRRSRSRRSDRDRRQLEDVSRSSADDDYSCVRYITDKSFFSRRILNGKPPSFKKALTAICSSREKPDPKDVRFEDPLPVEPDRGSCKTQSSAYYTIEFPDLWRSDEARARAASIKRVRMHFCLYPSRNQETPGRVRLTTTAFAAPATNIGTSFKELETSSQRCGWFRNETCFDRDDFWTEDRYFTGRCSWMAVDIAGAVRKALVVGQQYIRVHARLEVLDAIGKPVTTCYSLLGNVRRKADIPFISFTYANSQQLTPEAIAIKPTSGGSKTTTVCRNESGVCALHAVNLYQYDFEALGLRVKSCGDCALDRERSLVTYHYCDGVCRGNVSNSGLLSDELSGPEGFCQAVYHREPIRVTVRRNVPHAFGTQLIYDTLRHFQQWDAKACHCPGHQAYRMRRE